MEIRLIVTFNGRQQDGYMLRCTQDQVVYMLPMDRDSKDITGVYLEGREIPYKVDARHIIIDVVPNNFQTLLIEYTPRKEVNKNVEK